MWKLKPSPKAIKATEKYVASLGRKREELTEEQWQLMANYIQNRRVAIPILIILGLISISFAFMYYHIGQDYIEDILPNRAINVTFEENSKKISISSEKIQRHLSYAKECFMKVGFNISLILFILMFVIGSLTLVRIQNKKTHRILLSKTVTTESGT